MNPVLTFAGDINVLSHVGTAVMAVGGIATQRTPDHISGYFTLMSAVTGKIIMVRQIGECPLEQAHFRFDSSLEKAHRLFDNPTHVSSWQSRDKIQGMHAGAIRTEQYIWSFAGLPEHCDEAAMVYVAYNFHMLTQDQVRDIFAPSSNTVGRTLFSKALKIAV
ncbi:MAG: hypothetical protein RLZZ67_330 [Candidatus Parcubacteria bacterium]|jgi:hypothetical protein